MVFTAFFGLAAFADNFTGFLGVSVYPDHGEDVRGLVHAADMAMYRAKAFPKDEAIRVVSATALPRAASARRLAATTVIAMPATGRKSQVGKTHL